MPVISVYNACVHFECFMHAHTVHGIAHFMLNYCNCQTGTVTLSMDANFGLCRRKAAGKSVHPPLSGSEFFFEQSEVDSYVTHYQCQSDSGTRQVSM